MAAPDERSLGEQAISGGRWSSLRTFALHGGTLVTTGVLTRLLLPEDFGLVAVSVAVVTMFDLITRVGFGASVVRRPELDRRAASTLFWAALSLGLAAGILAVVLATPAATLAGSPEASGLVRVAALTLPLGLAGTVPAGLLFRDLRFRATTLIDVGTTVVYGVAAIGLAFAGWGAMAVVVGQVVRGIVALVALLTVSRFRPALVFDRRIIREDLAFSSAVLGEGVLSYTNRNADYWFVGNRLGPGPLGAYYVAYAMPNLLRQRFNSIGHQVLYPVVSKFQNDEKRIRGAYLKVLRFVSFLVVPTMLGMAVVADLAVRLGFGPGWDAAVTPMRIVAVASAAMSLGVVTRPIFLALGKPRLTVVGGLIGFTVMAVSLVLIWDDVTLVGVAFAAGAGLLADVICAQVFVARILAIKMRSQVVTVAPYVLSSAAMVAAVSGLRLTAIGQLPVLGEATVLVASGLIAYLGVGLLFFRKAFQSQLEALAGFVGLRRS